MKGLVIKNTGSFYRVKTEDGIFHDCKIKGNFRLKGIRSTNPIAVGDIVTIDPSPDQISFITEIQPRQNYIIRRSSNLSKESHILAANIDQAVLIITLTQPATHTIFIDRFLATAQAYHIPVRLVINKIDVHTPEDQEYAEAFMNLYRQIGYECYPISAKTQEGIESLRSMLANRITLFSGNSGVGKSSLINRLIPDLSLRVGEVSQSHHKGMHTTTFSEMFPLSEDGYIIDTPGVKGFGTIDFKQEEVAHYFVEIFARSANCRFNNCTHRQEPGCAVLAALEKHQISQSRYDSYLSILADSAEGKYR